MSRRKPTPRKSSRRRRVRISLRRRVLSIVFPFMLGIVRSGARWLGRAVVFVYWIAAFAFTLVWAFCIGFVDGVKSEYQRIRAGRRNPPLLLPTQSEFANTISSVRRDVSKPKCELEPRQLTRLPDRVFAARTLESGRPRAPVLVATREESEL